MTGARKDWSAALVINTFEDQAFLPAALRSACAQTVPFDQIIVVDDGSRRPPVDHVAEFPRVRLVIQENAGLAAARNRGLAESSCRFVAFLDADDLLRPTALADGLAAHRARPGCAFVYGAHRLVNADGRPLGDVRYAPIEDDAYATLLRGNAVAMHGAVLYDRAALAGAGGFDPTLRLCEDYDLYLRLAHTGPVTSHPNVVALYRRHSGNVSRDRRSMLRTVLAVHGRQRQTAERDPHHAAAFADGQRNWRSWYAAETLAEARRQWRSTRSPVAPVRLIAEASRMAPGHLAGWAGKALLRRLPRGRRPPRFGDLDRAQPFSRVFGFDRGTPIDRHYIERFLAANAACIRGRVLEVGDDAYCRRFGADIAWQDVLHVDSSNPAATIVGDLSRPGTLPADAFDCMVLTQTLHLVFDLKESVRQIHRALKPGGVALVTVPGISPVDRNDWGDIWYWALTTASARRLFDPVFGPGRVTYGVGGNVYAATAFVHGLAIEEIDKEKLRPVDASTPLVITIRAERATSDS